MTPERRDVLREKGQLLIQKACGSRNPGACLRGFVRHHLALGEREVIEDLLASLQEELTTSATPSESIRSLILLVESELDQSNQ